MRRSRSIVSDPAIELAWLASGRGHLGRHVRYIDRRPATRFRVLSVGQNATWTDPGPFFAGSHCRGSVCSSCGFVAGQVACCFRGTGVSQTRAHARTFSRVETRADGGGFRRSLHVLWLLRCLAEPRGPPVLRRPAIPRFLRRAEKQLELPSHNLPISGASRSALHRLFVPTYPHASSCAVGSGSRHGVVPLGLDDRAAAPQPDDVRERGAHSSLGDPGLQPGLRCSCWVAPDPSRASRHCERFRRLLTQLCVRNFRLLGDSIVKGDAGRWFWLLKKAEEIEKLAHEIRKRSKGSGGRESRLLAVVPPSLLLATGRRVRDWRSLAPSRKRVRNPGSRANRLGHPICDKHIYFVRNLRVAV